MAATVKTPKFSVIVPAYNIEAYVEESLTSLKNQIFTSFECIVVNDGSTDATEARIKKCIAKDTRFQLVSQKNGGLANARNAGFDKAIGEYVLYLDGDDVYEHRLLKVVNNRLTATDADIVIYNSDGLNDETQIRNGARNIMMQNEFVLQNQTFSAADISTEIFNLFYNSVWTKAFRRQLLLDNHLRFDDELKRIEDLPFTNGALVVAKSITFVDEILLHYRYNVHHSNTVNNYKRHLDIIRSAGLFRKFLQDNGCLKQFQQSFDNAIINDIEYYLWWLSLYPQGAETFAKVKVLVHDYGIGKRPIGYFRKADYYHLSQVIATGTYEDYLRYVLRYLRDAQLDGANESERNRATIDEMKRTVQNRDTEIDGLKQAVFGLQRETDYLNGELQGLLHSKSYRIGRAATKPLRIFIDAQKRKTP